MIAEICLALEVAIGLVFLWSAATKAARPAEFFDALSDYGVERPMLAVLVGSALIALEATVAVTHLTGWQLQMGAALAIVLLTVFTFTVLLALIRGAAVACLCFGARSGEMASMHTLARLLLLGASELVMAGVWWMSSETGWTLPYRLDGARALAALAGSVAMLLVAAWLVEIPASARRLAKKRSLQRHSASSSNHVSGPTGGQHVAHDTQSS
jgi:hypothetical protein